MKKLLALFAVLALTAPVFAADGDPNVAITCDDLGNGLVQVGYEIKYEDGLDPAARVRGFAFNMTASNSCLITAISEYDAEGAPVPADPNEIPVGYSVYMGSIGFGTDPNTVDSFGDPVAPSGPPKNYPDTLGGLGTTGITVEMGSLYPTGGTQPPASGNLFKIQLTDPTSAGTCSLTIVANTTRGSTEHGTGIVLEDGSSANLSSIGCTIQFDCYIVGQPRYYDNLGNPGPVITQANYDAWVAVGKPACWCCPHHGYGDTDGNGFINANDYLPIQQNPGPSINCPRADIDHNGFINANDYLPIQQHPGAVPTACPDCSGC